jgi:hypothetical protein
MSNSNSNQKFIEELWKILKNTLIIKDRKNWGSSCNYKKHLRIDDEANLGILAWRNPRDILEECRRIFFRLTKRFDQTLIPLWDLMDEHPMLLLFYGDSAFHRETPKVEAFSFLKYLFAHTVRKIPCPIKYDPENAVFTNLDENLQVLLDLEQSFAEWEKLSLKKV